MLNFLVMPKFNVFRGKEDLAGTNNLAFFKELNRFCVSRYFRIGSSSGPWNAI